MGLYSLTVMMSEILKQVRLTTGIWPKKVDPLGLQNLRYAGAKDPQTMHPGGQLSRNDFGDEKVGYVSSVVDPGDDWILDWCAELGFHTSPVFKECKCGDCKLCYV